MDCASKARKDANKSGINVECDQKPEKANDLIEKIEIPGLRMEGENPDDQSNSSSDELYEGVKTDCNNENITTSSVNSEGDSICNAENTNEGTFGVDV